MASQNFDKSTDYYVRVENARREMAELLEPLNVGDKLPRFRDPIDAAQKNGQRKAMLAWRAETGFSLEEMGTEYEVIRA